MRPYFENEFAEFWIEDDILFFVYKKDSFINLESAKKIVEDRTKFQDGKTYPVFCDMRLLGDTDKAGRDYLADEGSHLVKVVAVLIGSPVARMMFNFYLTIHKPLVPTKMFTDEAAAIAYLKSFRDN